MLHSSDRWPEPAEILLNPEMWNVVEPAATAYVEPAACMAPAERQAWSLANAHSTPSLEVMLAVRGEDWFGMGGVLHPCRPGTLFLIPPGVAHDFYYPVTANGLEHLWLRFLGDHVFSLWLSVEAGNCTRMHERLGLVAQERLGVSMSAFPGEARLPGSRFDIARLRLLVGLVAVHIAESLELGDSRTRERPRSASATQAKVAAAIRRHIDDTAGRGVTLAHLEHFSGYSKFHLNRVFRKHSGCTVHQYIDRARRRREGVMRLHGERNADIAAELGFSETAAYLRWRRQHGG